MKAHDIDKWRSLPLIARVARDPISATRALHREYGPFVRIELPFRTKDGSNRVNLIADADLYKTVMSNSDLWRNVQITWGGLPNHASSRLSLGMTRLTGERHEHYRKMFIAPLKRPVVAAMSPEMALVAADEMAKWPRNRPVDLQHAVTVMTTKLAVALLFGSDFDRALPITDLITRQFKAFRVLPGRQFLRWIWNASRQEKVIMDWANEKRGNRNARDLLSVLVNNPDLDGTPPAPDIICGIICFLYAAAYDTCLNGITWTLLLLTQHPEIMEALTAEIDGALDGELPTMDRIGQLLLLDRVIREGMRLMPPVPLQMRKTPAANQARRRKGGISRAGADQRPSDRPRPRGLSRARQLPAGALEVDQAVAVPVPGLRRGRPHVSRHHLRPADGQDRAVDDPGRRPRRVGPRHAGRLPHGCHHATGRQGRGRPAKPQ